jgi:hypothetical protein
MQGVPAIVDKVIYEKTTFAETYYILDGAGVHGKLSFLDLLLSVRSFSAFFQAKAPFPSRQKPIFCTMAYYWASPYLQAPCLCCQLRTQPDSSSMWIWHGAMKEYSQHKSQQMGLLPQQRLSSFMTCTLPTILSSILSTCNLLTHTHPCCSPMHAAFASMRPAMRCGTCKSRHSKP